MRPASILAVIAAMLLVSATHSQERATPANKDQTDESVKKVKELRKERIATQRAAARRERSGPPSGGEDPPSSESPWPSQASRALPVPARHGHQAHSTHVQLALGHLTLVPPRARAA